MTVKEFALKRGAVWVRGVQIGVLMTLGVLIPSLGMPQPLTGPLVNALLILSVATVGVGPAIVIGMITPLSAVMHGVLPLPLMVMIPFIALGNAALVIVFSALRNKNEWLALGAAAVAKFVLLYAAVTLLIVHPLSVVVGGAQQTVILPAAMINMMRWPQLATALIGGFIALGIMRAARRHFKGLNR
jgi:hypothetical protein